MGAAFKTQGSHHSAYYERKRVFLPWEFLRLKFSYLTAKVSQIPFPGIQYNDRHSVICKVQ